MRMIYKAPGAYLIDGAMVDFKVFENDELKSAYDDGWFNTPAEAIEAYSAVIKELDEEVQDKPRRGRPPK